MSKGVKDEASLLYEQHASTYRIEHVRTRLPPESDAVILLVLLCQRSFEDYSHGACRWMATSSAQRTLVANPSL